MFDSYPMSNLVLINSLPAPLPELLAQEGLTDLFVNGFKQVWWSDSAGLHQVLSPFKSEDELAAFAQTLAAIDDKRLDLAMPFADVSLPGGLRAHLVLASGCSDSTLISIRSHAGHGKSLEQLAAAGFLATGSWLAWQVPVLLACTFLMGLHSTLFGPVKFAYLPEALRERELMGGNGMVEMGTFVAILLGNVAGGLLIALPGIGATAVAVVMLVISFVLLLLINALQTWQRRRTGAPT